MLQAQQFFDLINNRRSILIISHRRPDADTLGANCALHFYLREKKQAATSFCADIIPEYFNSLSPVIRDFITEPDKIQLTGYDLIITVDCGDLALTGLDKKLTARLKNNFLINIDHHCTNPGFGDFNIIDNQASSTSEIIYNLFKQHNIPLAKPITQSLLGGILCDTNYFTNSGTTAGAIKLTSDLLSHGAKISRANQSLIKNQDLPMLKIWGLILSRLRLNNAYGNAVSYVAKSDLEQYGLPDIKLSFLADYLITNIKNTSFVALIYDDQAGQISGSFRTDRHDINLAELAQALGGGGHKKAAGFRCAGKLVISSEQEWRIE